MIFTAGYRRRGLEQWQSEQAEAEQELTAVSDSLAAAFR